VELRNRLGLSTELKVPSTLVFDHPTPAAVATLVRSKLSGRAGAPDPIDAQLDRLDALLHSIATDSGAQERVKARLQALARRVETSLAEDSYADTDSPDTEEALQSATDDEVFALIDRRRDGGESVDRAGRE
jgi:hypothetical protein